MAIKERKESRSTTKFFDPRKCIDGGIINGMTKA
jgi:hypothetical protein